jgi:hypothetical protein
MNRNRADAAPVAGLFSDIEPERLKPTLVVPCIEADGRRIRRDISRMLQLALCDIPIADLGSQPHTAD